MSRIQRRRAELRGLSDETLMALVVQALEHKGTAYLVDAVEAIVSAFERAPLTRLEEQQERIARLVRILGEIDPERMPQTEAA